MKLIAQSIPLEMAQIEQIKKMLSDCNWNENQINGQIGALQKFIKDKDCLVLFALEGTKIVGYASAQFYSWNHLSQIHGLAIDPQYRKKGVATKLVHEIEDFMKKKHARGVYADTPVNNAIGRLFYKNNHFKEAYIMPEYYDAGLDGITYLKVF